eukprot:4805172-Pyramimonas_sp.AAC.1
MQADAHVYRLVRMYENQDLDTRARNKLASLHRRVNFQRSKYLRAVASNSVTQPTHPSEPPMAQLEKELEAVMDVVVDLTAESDCSH